MSELIEAAKIVCDLYDYTGSLEECKAVNRLIRAVELAEKQEAKPWTKPIPTDFKEWWETCAPNKYGMGPAYHAWSAGQHAERERLRQKVAEIIRLEDFDYVMAVFDD